jgi:hypothetical protein
LYHHRGVFCHVDSVDRADVAPERRRPEARWRNHGGPHAVDVRRIHPEDRIIEDLGLGQVDGMDGNWLDLEIERAFGVSIRAAWPELKTVRDVVEHVSVRLM